MDPGGIAHPSGAWQQGHGPQMMDARKRMEKQEDMRMKKQGPLVIEATIAMV